MGGITLRIWNQMAFILAIIGVIQFILLISIAMVFYAGGNESNPAAPGYSFLLNSLSDLGRTVAWSGKNNLISQVLFGIAMILWGISFAPSIQALSSLLLELKRGRLFTKMGIIFAYICVGLLFCEVAFFPVDLQPQLHGVFAASSYFSLLVMEILYALVMLSDKNYPHKYAICFLAVAVAIINYFIFNTPLSQKLISITISIATLVVFYNAWKMNKKRALAYKIRL